MSGSVTRWAVPFFIMAAVVIVFAPSAAQAQGEARRLLDEGKQAFLEGDYETAMLRFEEVMRADPSLEEALRLRERAGYAFLVEVLAKGGKYKSFAEWLLSRAEGFDDERKSNPELIQEIIDDLMSEDMTRYQWALERLEFEVGEYAAPKLCEMLGNETDRKARERAVIALSRMGAQVVLPVIECLNSQNIRQKQGAVIVLGNIGDLRAVADVKRLYEDPKEPAEVKDVATSALRKIARRDPGQLRPAREYYYNKAIMYYQNHPAIIKNYDRNWLFWKWNDETGTLDMEKVPQWLYNFRLAEEACYDALDIDYTYTNIWPVLALVNVAEYNEVLVHLRDAPAAIQDKLQELSDKNFAGWVGGMVVGERALYDALDIALRSQDALVAVSVIRALRYVASGGGIPARGTQPPPGMLTKPTAAETPPGGEAAAVGDRRPEQDHPLLGPAGTPGAKLGAKGAWPLLQALTYPDKRVRYAAAVTLIRIHNRSPKLRRSAFAMQNVVLQVVIEALGESGARSILVGTPDIQTRNDLVGEMVNMGYFAYGADSAADTFKRALRFPSEDLIILDMDMATELIIHASSGDVEHKETIIDALRADYRTKDVPILVLCDANQLDRAKELFPEGRDVKGYITTPMNFSEIKIQLTGIFAAFPLDDKSRATRISREAAEAVASIDPFFTTFALKPPVSGEGGAGGGSQQWRDVVAALMAVIERRPDEVRIPALDALGHLAPADAIPAITRVVHNKDANLPKVRAAAAHTLGEIFLRAQSLPEETYEVLLDGLRDESSLVREACGAALGNAPIKAEERYKALKKARVNPRK